MVLGVAQSLHSWGSSSTSSKTAQETILHCRSFPSFFAIIILRQYEENKDLDGKSKFDYAWLLFFNHSLKRNGFNVKG